MPMHRKNTSKRVNDGRVEEAWFQKNVERQRNRKKMAKASKRKNRGK